MNSRKAAAITMRKEGGSIKSIAKKLGAAQSSVSLWVRSVKLTETQISKLRSNMHSPRSIEKRRASRLKSELAKRNAVIKNARLMVNRVSARELWLIGTSLYWAEGGKTRSMVRFSNGDPSMIELMLRFFREICGVEESKLRGYIHIHSSLDVKAAEEYWQAISNIPKEKFYKTYNKTNKSSKGTRNSLPYGVFDIYILDASLLLKIKGWALGIYGNTMRTAAYQRLNHEQPDVVL